MEHTAEIQAKLEKIAAAIDHAMEDGKTYYSSPIRSEYGTSGGMIYEIVDGAKTYHYRESEIEKALDDLSFDEGLFNVTSTLPPFAKARYTFQKGQPIKFEKCTPEMILEDLQMEFLREVNEDEYTKVIGPMEFFDGEKVQIDAAMQITHPEREFDLDFPFASDDFECLFYALDKKVKKMHVHFADNKLTLKSYPAFPKLGLEEMDTSQDLEVDAKDLNALCAFMESGSGDKIEAALKAVKPKSRFYKEMENRYLNLIKARTKNPDATLNDAVEGLFNKMESKVLSDRNISETFISFSYNGDSESKVVVDMIGALTTTLIDIEEYKAMVHKCQEDDTITHCAKDFSKTLKDGLSTMSTTHPDGWFSTFCALASTMNLEKIMLEKTSFDASNNSSVLEAYMLGIGLLARQGRALYYDIHQSDTPDLTQMLWMMPIVPQLNWSDVDPEIPKSPLNIKRTAKMRIGDFGRWKAIPSP